MSQLIIESKADDFKAAMSCFPSGVTIVTTRDRSGQPWGFTASAFTSLSLDPPLVLVCLAKSAQCHPAFQSADRWMIHVVGDEHADLAFRFASRGADKFGGGEFEDQDGLPALPGVPARIECAAHAKHDGGDHTILVGEVTEVELSNVSPAVYHDRRFHVLPGGRS